MFRSQTDEQLAARWDAEPYVRTYNGAHERRIDEFSASKRGARFENSFGEIVVTRFAPRVECIPSTPIFCQGSMGGAPLRHLRRSPVNPILVAFRDGNQGDNFEWWSELLYTPEQIDHARKVLTRLSALS